MAEAELVAQFIEQGGDGSSLANAVRPRGVTEV